MENRYTAGANEIVHSLVLKPNGSVAWIGTQDAHDDVPMRVEVNEFEVGRGRRTIDDQGSIELKSLSLSEDRRRIFWMNAGEPRSARLR